MRRLVDLGWVVRVNRGHYRFVSVYKIALSLSLNIKLSATINSEQLVKGSANWKSYLMAKIEAFIIKRKSYVNRNGIIDRDGATNKGSINRELIATRYLQKHIGLSPSTVSRRRKYNHNKYLAQYNPHFDKLNIKRKAELMFFLDQLKYSDLNESEKELFRNIEWDSSLKKYRVRTSTKVLIKGHSLNYNNSSSSYKKRYAEN